MVALLIFSVVVTECGLLRPHLLWHGDPVSVDECEHFVVVHHRVHALDPQSVHWSVEHDPLLIRALVFGGEQQSSLNNRQSNTILFILLDCFTECIYFILHCFRASFH